jgi:hypothetical protein
MGPQQPPWDRTQKPPGGKISHSPQAEGLRGSVFVLRINLSISNYIFNLLIGWFRGAARSTFIFFLFIKRKSFLSREKGPGHLAEPFYLNIELKGLRQRQTSAG